VNGAPATSFPSAKGSASPVSWNGFEPTISRKLTSAFRRFGISMPTAAFPGIGATMRIRCALSESARSSCRWRIWFTFTPGAGSYSKSVMTGPG